MKHGFLSLVVALCAPLLVQAADKESAFPFTKGDRVMFLGDSITEQYQYSTYIELYLTTRFPDWKLTFLNAGIGGDTATGGARRFQTHVLDEKPTIVTINFGMNDGGYGGLNKGSAANYIKQTEAMLKAAEKAKVRVALMSPNAVQISTRPNLKTYLATQKEFYGPLAKLAAKYKVPFVDQYAVTRKVLEKITADQSKVSPFPDGVHTAPAGGLLMAHTILTGLKAPGLVSDVVIDAKDKQSKTEKCTVKDLKVTGKGITFERADDALPMPILGTWKSILPYIADVKGLNYYGLKVTGLAAGKYKLTIDGKEAATYTEEQLAAGVNLGLLDKGPIYDQGVKVSAAIAAKNAMVHQRFRGVVMYNAPDWLADVVKERKPLELKKRMDKIEAAQAAIWKLATPTPHKFALTLVK